jgi:hypothetical protein
MLRIEIWFKDNMEWSLEGDGSDDQYRQTKLKLRSLFPEDEELNIVIDKENVRTVPLDEAVDEVKSLGGRQNLMLCDNKYEKMMMFIYKH